LLEQRQIALQRLQEEELRLQQSRQQVCIFKIIHLAIVLSFRIFLLWLKILRVTNYDSIF
jgi:hypothetical protein